MVPLSKNQSPEVTILGQENTTLFIGETDDFGICGPATSVAHSQDIVPGVLQGANDREVAALSATNRTS